MTSVRLFSCVVGAELCSRFVVRVDFDARRIVLWERSVAIDARHAEILPADFSAGVPVIKARIRAAGMNPADATLIVGLAEPPGTVSFTYRYAADAGFLDASKNGTLPIEVGDVTKTPLSAIARLPREPDSKLLFADGIVSARALTRSWILFDAPRARIVVGR